MFIGTFYLRNRIGGLHKNLEIQVLVHLTIMFPSTRAPVCVCVCVCVCVYLHIKTKIFDALFFPEEDAFCLTEEDF